MQLKNKFDKGEFAVLAEMDPPKGVDTANMTANALRVKGEVDAFVVPEMGNAVMRMSSLGGAMILQAQGLETVLQLNCRDRNRIALQADLLAAYAPLASKLMTTRSILSCSDRKHRHKAQRGRFQIIPSGNLGGCCAGQ